MEISKISIGNFRIFEKRTEFDISPITILTGANNSGKSTFIKAIQLLVESAKSSGLLYLLKQKSNTGYSEPNDIIDISSNKDNIHFEFEFDLSLESFEQNNGKSRSLAVVLELEYQISDFCRDFNVLGKYFKIKRLCIRKKNKAPIFSLSEYSNSDPEINKGREYFYHSLHTDSKLFLDLIGSSISEYNEIKSIIKYLGLSEADYNAIIKIVEEIIVSENDKLDSCNYQFGGGYSGEDDSFKEFSSLNQIVYAVNENTSKNTWGDWEGPESISYIDATKKKLIEELEKESILLNEEDNKLLINVMYKLALSLNNSLEKVRVWLVEEVGKNILNCDYYIPASNRGGALREFDRKDNNLSVEKIFTLIECKGLKMKISDNHSERFPFKYQFVNEVLGKVFEFKYHFSINYNNQKKKQEFIFQEIIKDFDILIFNAFLIKDSIERDKAVDELFESQRNSPVIALADFGSGMYHLVILLIQIEIAILKGSKELYYNDYKAPSCNSVVFVEEPEISLHPNYQSLLADVLVYAYTKYNVKFIIETHSEYLIRKMQLLVAKKNIEADRINIFYMDKNDTSKNKNAKISINTDGTLTKDFGPGFFDEATKVIFELWKTHSKN